MASRLIPSLALAASLVASWPAAARAARLPRPIPDHRYKGGEQGKLFSDQGLVLGVGKNAEAARIRAALSG